MSARIQVPPPGPAQTKPDDLKRDTVNPDDIPAGYTFTTDHGVPVPDTDNWLKAIDGEGTGPSLLEDQIAREKITRFDHERIPGSFSLFSSSFQGVSIVSGKNALCTQEEQVPMEHSKLVYDNSASQRTTAGVLTDPTRTTSTFVRFSTVAGSRGSADTVRDVRGFAVKFYTNEGNWDLVGNNIPVFFIQDATKFPDIIHAVKPEPHNEIPQGQSAHNNFWDFVGLQPESAHMVMWVMSDRGVPRSYRMMQGFGVNTYTLVNATNERFFVKFHWTPDLGVYSLTWDEALKLGGQDPDFHRRDLEEAIKANIYPKWYFDIQVIPEADQDKFTFDPLDATKIWPVEEVRLNRIGEMVLNRTVTEYFPEVEQVAFCTAHVVTGIGFSDDPLLQGRNFSYFDTQISRLGVSWEELPINRPICPILNTHRDGKTRHRIHDSQINYWPNRKMQYKPIPVESGGYLDYLQKVQGMKQRLRGKKLQEYYKQAQLYYNSLKDFEKAHLMSAIIFELSHCDDPVVYETYIKILINIDLKLAQQVATAVGGTVPTTPGIPNDGKTSPSLSQTYYAPFKPTIVTRRIAFLVTDGFDNTQVQTIQAALKAAGAFTFIIGPRRGMVYPAGVDRGGPSGGVPADHSWESQRSTGCDAILIPDGIKHVADLTKSGRAIQWVREAFGHLKAIGAIGEAIKFVRDVAMLPGVQFAPADTDEVKNSYGVVTVGKPKDLSVAEGGFVDTFILEVSKHRNYDREKDGYADMVPY